MGILQSVIRCLGCITDEEDGGRPQSPLFPQANRSSSSLSSCHYYLNTRENLDQYPPRTNNTVASTGKNLDQYAPRTNNTVASTGKNLDQYAPRTNNTIASTCQWQNGKTAVSGEKGQKKERVKEGVMFNSITDKENGARPQSLLFPQANRSSSSPSSRHYYLNTGKNLDQYASRTNNTVASTRQWQNGKTTVSGEKGEENERVKERVIFNFVTDEKDGVKPRSPLHPQANRSSSSPSSCHYYLNTGKNLEQYASRTNNTVASTRQWQNGKTAVSGKEAEKKEIVKEQVIFNSTVVAALPQERRIKHYSSNHRILLVGEGDFSFSTCLAATFGSASNMIATSLDSPAFLVRNYQKALSNIMDLIIRKCKVLHEVDATDMANHQSLHGIKFDRIIYNFPYAGLILKKLSRDDQMRQHKELVSLFLKNAKEMLRKDGEIHITHKTNGFHKEWNVERIARGHKLRLIEEVQFCKDDYPGYDTKFGFGGDNNFDCYPAKTYKFGLAVISC
ncbi:hypothetical protein CDL12_08013 [Handroanthus impetiginosus]|uniref:25S rRNA (uridine-N(3))-methyltransferase BMT5-like domain-containing protein n=1 Tax=Handroanthus impetiginosus TaxID=429701 RepID=A0A2G9HP46_9LAMI|nr:hypothetical protein CDL12_08013 [Handroanthus impetiginosus]